MGMYPGQKLTAGTDPLIRSFSAVASSCRQLQVVGERWVNGKQILSSRRVRAEILASGESRQRGGLNGFCFA